MSLDINKLAEIRAAAYIHEQEVDRVKNASQPSTNSSGRGFEYAKLNEPKSASG